MTAPTSNPASAKAKSPVFDGLSFVKYMKDIGRAYRKQAMELVSTCRIFAQAQEQLFRPYDDLRSVLEVVDDALGSATETRKKASKDVDKKFKDAIDALIAYEKKYHTRETVSKKMVEAGEKDKSSSTTLNRLKEKLRPLAKEPTKTVEFLLHESLPDQSPTSVKQELGQNSNLQEILWNFSRYKDKRRLTLKQNPHFYEALPLFPEKYGGKFRTDPIETFQFEKISVLTDNSGRTGRVFLETAEGTRAFGNVWVPKDAIIFKDVCGKLEGESIVGAAIQGTPDLWCFEEPLLSPTSRSPNRSSPSSTTTATSPTLLKGDWREPIRRMLRYLNFNVRISAKPPTNTSPSHSAPSSPNPLPFSSSNVWYPSPTPQSPPTITIQIPEVSQGPLTPSSYRTARSTPTSQRPPAAEQSPRSPALPSLRPPSISSTQPTPAPTTATPLPIPPALQSPLAVPLTGPAVPDPTACLLPDGEVPLEGALSVDPIPSRTFIAEVPSTGPNVTITSPLQVIKPHAERKEAEVAEHVPNQFTPSFEHEVATVVPSDLGVPAPLTQAQIVVPTKKRSDPLPLHQAENAVPTKRKKHWYQKCFDIIKNKLAVVTS